MDYEALYAHRFKNVDLSRKLAVWSVISGHIMSMAGRPDRVLDPACGTGEFVATCGAQEVCAVDLGAAPRTLPDGATFFSGSFLEVDLPRHHFDLVFASNVLEHMANQQQVNDFLAQARTFLRPGGRIVVMGPNFKYCAKEYFDCADHTVPLTHVSVEEHLVAAGYEIERTIPRFLPYSFRSSLPANPSAVRAYLAMPILWRLLGKQFLLVGINR